MMTGGAAWARAALAITVAASSLPACGGDRGQRAVPTIVVKKSRFARVVDAEGHLKPVQSTTIAAPRGTEGPPRIAWLTQDGSVVKKGEVVARFDDTDLRAK